MSRNRNEAKTGYAPTNPEHHSNLEHIATERRAAEGSGTGWTGSQEQDYQKRMGEHRQTTSCINCIQKYKPDQANTGATLNHLMETARNSDRLSEDNKKLLESLHA